MPRPKNYFFKLVGDAPPSQESQLGKGRGPAQGVCSPSSKNNFVIDASNTKLFFELPPKTRSSKQKSFKLKPVCVERLAFHEMHLHSGPNEPQPRQAFVRIRVSVALRSGPKCRFISWPNRFFFYPCWDVLGSAHSGASH